MQKYTDIDDKSLGMFKHIIAGAFFQAQKSCISRIEEINTLINGDILFIDIIPGNLHHQLILSESERGQLMKQLKALHYISIPEAQWSQFLNRIRRLQNCESSVYKGPFFLSGLTENGIDYSLTTQFLTLSFKEEGIFNWHKDLGFYFPLNGTVIPGNKIGRTIGFPTINIQPNDVRKLIPPMGVYTGFAKIKDTWHKAMINIGIRPTLELTKVTIEAHVFDFDDEIYGEQVALHFISRIRDEMKFKNLDNLQTQLLLDKEKTISALDALTFKPTEEDDLLFVR